MAKQKLLVSVRDRYRTSSKDDKSRILDEFIATIDSDRLTAIGRFWKLRRWIARQLRTRC